MQPSFVDLLVKNVMMTTTTNGAANSPTSINNSLDSSTLQVLAEIANNCSASSATNTSVQQILSTMLAISSSQTTNFTKPSSINSNFDALNNLKRVINDNNYNSGASTSTSFEGILSSSNDKINNILCRGSSADDEIDSPESKSEMLSSTLSPQERILSIMNPFGVNGMLPRNLQFSGMPQPYNLKKPKLESSNG